MRHRIIIVSFLLSLGIAKTKAANVRFVVTVKKGGTVVGLGALLTSTYVATSCRLIATENKGRVKANVSPQQYAVGLLGSNAQASKFVFHPKCGFDKNRIGYDLALILLGSPLGKVNSQAVFSSLSRFNTINYLWEIIRREVKCTAFTIDAKPVHVTFSLNSTKCLGTGFCENDTQADCFLPMSRAIYLCVKADKPCEVAPGSPLVCEGLLQGIMLRGPNCLDNSLVNPMHFARIDYGSEWIESVVCLGNRIELSIYVYSVVLTLTKYSSS